MKQTNLPIVDQTSRSQFRQKPASRTSIALAALTGLVMAASSHASTVVPFNVYWAGDAGGLTLSNKSYVAGMANIGSGSSGIGEGITVVLQDQDFDTGPTKNYGAAADNTIGVYGLGAINAGDQENPFSASITGSGIESITLYFGDYENFNNTPVIWNPGDTNAYSGWSGTVSGTLSLDGTSLVLTSTSGNSNGVHIFGGSVTVAAIPEPATSLSMLGSLCLLFVRRRKA